MKFPFGKKTADSPATTPKKTPVSTNVTVQPNVPNGKKMILTGLTFVAISFLGAVFLLYLTVNAQSAKEVQLKDLNQKLVMVSTEKDVANRKVAGLQNQVGRVLDIDKVVSASQKVHGDKEISRKEGSMWIDRKTANFIVTLGALNGVANGSRLEVYDGENKFATLKVVTALDVVSYVEPVDKKMIDFLKDYYTVKIE